MAKYVCEQCGYETSRKYNYTRHLNKHLNSAQLSNEQLNEQPSNDSKVLKNEQKSLKNTELSSSEILTEQVSSEPSNEQRTGTIYFDADELLKLTDKEGYRAEQEHISKQKRLPSEIIAISEKLAKTTKPIKKEAIKIEANNSKAGFGLVALVLSLLFIVIFWQDIKQFLGLSKRSSLIGNNPDFRISRE